jgi:hypothetical protein
MPVRQGDLALRRPAGRRHCLQLQRLPPLRRAWIYGHEGEDVHVSGETTTYLRRPDGGLSFHFCPSCGCLSHWRGTRTRVDGRRRLAVNVRLATDPDAVANIPIDHFDGADKFEDLPRDGRCVRDMWF